MTADPDPPFVAVWNSVVAELNGDVNGDRQGDPSLPVLTPQQRAWLKLVKPLVIAEGFALLSVPTPFVQNEIERHLREPIVTALSRKLGQRVELGVRIATPTDEPEDAPDSFADSPAPASVPAGRPTPTRSTTTATPGSTPRRAGRSTSAVPSRTPRRTIRTR